MRRLVPLAFLLVGCSHLDNTPNLDNIGHYVGYPCTVRVKPAALGLAATIPMSLETDSLNGGTVSTSGTLVRVDENWVIIRKGTQGPDLAIARSEVLSMVMDWGSKP